MVVDTSVVLALFFDEPHGEWAAQRLNEHAADLCMSTVNLTEALIRIRSRQPTDADALEERLFTSDIRFVAPDTSQAQIAAEARLRFGRLNLGDCFAYALSVVEDCPILALDADFRVVDRDVISPTE